MFNEATIKELENFKEFEEIKVGDKYKIQFIYLNLELILKYSKELEQISNKNQSNILKFIQQFDTLADDVIKIVDKDNKSIKLNKLPLSAAIKIATEWIDLNFTNGGKTLIEPIEALLSKLTGQKIDLKVLLASFSQLLSAAGTAPKEQS